DRPALPSVRCGLLGLPQGTEPPCMSRCSLRWRYLPEGEPMPSVMRFEKYPVEQIVITRSGDRYRARLITTGKAPLVMRTIRVFGSSLADLLQELKRLDKEGRPRKPRT